MTETKKTLSAETLATLRSFARDDGPCRLTKRQATALAVACAEALAALAPSSEPEQDPVACPWCGCETRLQRGGWAGHRTACPLRP